jgi:hypothetical protein
MNNMIVAVHKGTAPIMNRPDHPGKVNINTGIDYYRNFITDATRNNFQWQ